MVCGHQIEQVSFLRVFQFLPHSIFIFLPPPLMFVYFNLLSKTRTVDSASAFWSMGRRSRTPAWAVMWKNWGPPLLLDEVWPISCEERVSTSYDTQEKRHENLSLSKDWKQTVRTALNPTQPTLLGLEIPHPGYTRWLCQSSVDCWHHPLWNTSSCMLK